LSERNLNKYDCIRSTPDRQDIQGSRGALTAALIIQETKVKNKKNGKCKNTS